ncbi:MAG: methionine--tRNA ligase [Actinobacteria bacterium]|uniref:methionine--tRNA ligase n=1 Tax=freshwater metagenome TaxID=449393 RepID=A0A6J6CPJ6_9ZZZZ|nr:methionine--tRNA ligase [Actinomycetota bacterium]
MGTYYLTTPIYYVNARPHLGHAYTTIVGDALARWHRLLGDDVHFLTGTDEHGLKIQQAADAAGMTPQEFTDSIAPLFEEAWKRLNISHDDFIRTTEARHYAGVQKLLQACLNAGDIELDTYSGLYCVPCEAYFTPEDLDGNNCPIHKRPVEHVVEENYFFRLSRFEQRLLDFYAEHPHAVVPEHRVNEVIGFIKQGLQDFSISRKTLKWGIPLPFDSSHVAYVWFDALANYITAIGYGTDDEMFNKWWPVNHHLIGKDIVRFHNVYWPAMLMSAGIEVPKGWAVGGWLLVGGEKMSKTQGNVVNPLDLVDEIGVDGFRYYVLADTIYGNDGDFTYEGLISRYNSDLANNLGNLAARIATVVEKKCGGLGTAPSPNSTLAPIAQQCVNETSQHWEQVQPSRALEATWQLIRATNAHLENHEPWKSEPGPEVDAVMGDALEALRIVTILAFPAMPDTAREIWRRIGMTTDIENCRIPADTQWGLYPSGAPVIKGDPLFPRRTIS